MKLPLLEELLTLREAWSTELHDDRAAALRMTVKELGFKEQDPNTFKREDGQVGVLIHLEGDAWKVFTTSAVREVAVEHAAGMGAARLKQFIDRKLPSVLRGLKSEANMVRARGQDE